MGYIDAMNADKDPLKEYSDWVESKILTSGHERLVENTLGLVGESGEEIASEIGDVIFYGTSLAMIFGFNLGDIIRMNMEKLNSRQERGVLQGSGDNR
jgi:NTP pyrophosphatase (non-canonical NTP hydrolase)